MREISIQENEAGQRLDKFLRKFFPEAPGSFAYKMLRKKNITLNGKKADGSEKLNLEDRVALFLSEETITKFRGAPKMPVSGTCAALDGEIGVLYEDRQILLADKPSGVLSQKAKPSDVSLNEWLTGYLLRRGEISADSLRTFRPSVCNRLDRNTSGIVICSKTLACSQKMGVLLKDRSLRKYYRLIVKGRLEEEALLEGYLTKDSRTNRVRIQKEGDGGAFIRTRYIPLRVFTDRTYLEVELITGKTHQIRAHLAGVGHPLLGDYKYGDRNFNDIYKKVYGIESQLLHAYRLEFPSMEPPFESLDRRVVLCPLPPYFKQLLEED